MRIEAGTIDKPHCFTCRSYCQANIRGNLKAWGGKKIKIEMDLCHLTGKYKVLPFQGITNCPGYMDRDKK